MFTRRNDELRLHSQLSYALTKNGKNTLLSVSQKYLFYIFQDVDRYLCIIFLSMHSHAENKAHPLSVPKLHT